MTEAFKQGASKRASVRKNVKQYRQRQELKPFLDEGGDLDIVAYFNSPHIKLKIAGMVDDALGGSRVNSQFLKWLSQLMGIYTEKREETVKFELSTADRIRIARETLNGLREQYKLNGGDCALCGRPKILRHEVCVGTEPKFSTGREVATVAVSTRPD